MTDELLSCERCGLVYAERRVLGGWAHWRSLRTGAVVTFIGPDGRKICDECMNVSFSFGGSYVEDHRN